MSQVMTGRAAESAATFGSHIAEEAEKPWVSRSGVVPFSGPKVW
jgi:hypothetical protein